MYNFNVNTAQHVKIFYSKRFSDNTIFENSDVANEKLTTSELDEKLVLGQPPRRATKPNIIFVQREIEDKLGSIILTAY